MNNEIKEILDYLKNKELYCTINGIEKKCYIKPRQMNY